ncbi:T9SS type A sorting domain-containing protein [Gaetbulibacter sp. M235]|uniref:T9SS type A sorting domain-containing protein n=1 Tax=Gaetbulibacter sp. M235 TaxID=3126510 RepID=UPI00374F7FD8
MKKLLLIPVFFLTITLQAQFNQDAPWMEKINSKMAKSSTTITFKDVVGAFDSYWETRNKNVKGSGYKPFKRWETHWKNFVKPDGTLPTSAELWDTWISSTQSKLSQTSADLSNWQPVGPFEHTNTGSWSAGQGRINAIIVDPNTPTTYYTGAPAGGIWKSINSGLTWTPLSDDLPQIGVSGIAIDSSNSNIIYIATGDDDADNSYSVGVMKSIDSGATWNTTGLNTSNSPTSMNDIYIHPANSNILWVATNNGVYKTIDSGVTWSNTNGLQGLNIKDIKLKPGDPNTIYAVSENTFYVSTDGGNSFSVSGTGLPASSGRLVIDVTIDNSSVVYVLSSATDNSFQGLYKSVDSGINFYKKDATVPATIEGYDDNLFDKSSQSWFDMALAVSNTNEDEVYVGVLNIWKSTNGGTSFTKLNNWSSPESASYTHADIHLLRFFNGTLFAGTDGGFYKSTNGGTTFTDLTSGLQIGQFYRVAVSKQSSNKMVGGLQDNGGYALNNNIWQNYYGADGIDTAINPGNSNLMYGFIQNGAALCISSESGANLNIYINAPVAETGTNDDGGNWVTPLSINQNGELFAGYSQLYTLFNGEWQQVSTNLGTTNIDFLELDDLDSNVIYIAVNNTLKKSIDKGITFNNAKVFSDDITSIEVNNTNNNIVYVTTSGIFGSVYKSTDGGFTFTSINGSLPNVTKNIIKHQDFHSQNPLFLGTSLGVYRYDDAIGDWELFDNNLPTVSVTDLEINLNDANITAATYGRGIWQSNLPTETLLNEISLVEIQGVNQSISCSSLDTAKILVKNLGSSNINSINIETLLNGVTDNTIWNGTLPQNETTIINIPSLLISSLGKQELKITTTINNDTFESNNSLTSVFYANSSETVNVVNDFETANDELITFNEADASSSSGYWERGVPTGILLNTATSGSNVYATNLSGNYSDSMKSYLITKCYNLSVLANPILKFNMAYDLEENWDVIYVQYSTDSGLNWNILGSATDLNWYNSDRTNASSGASNDCFNCPGAQWTGSNTTIQQYSYNLAPLNSETNIIFRFVFQSDEYENREGVIIDDLVVEGSTLATKDFDKTDIAIYPNPSKNIFNIKTKTLFNFDFNVTDITGKVVLKTKNINVKHNLYQLDMSEFSAGIYFLNIISNGGKLSKKLVLN